jgi:hypothetical protein
MGRIEMNFEELISTIGSSDFRSRVEVMASSGISREEATDTVAKQMIEETHRGVRALLLLQGRNTDSMSDAEAIHAQR